MSTWAAKRRLFYLSCVGLFFLTIGVVFYATQIYKPPSCFDGIQNAFEQGVDCGGNCQLVCPLSVTDINVRWAEAFPIGAGLYNLAAVIENPNNDKSTTIEYVFRAYDNQNLLITEVFNTIDLEPAEIKALFEPSINTGSRVVDQVFLEFDSKARWLFDEGGQDSLVSDGYSIRNEDSIPRMQASIKNVSNVPVRDITVVAALYDEDDNIYQVSQTYIDRIAAQDKSTAFFTWRKPFEVPIQEVDIFMRHSR